MTTYKIVRFFINEDKEPETIKSGLTREEAREHCKDPASKGDGWFDGYAKEGK